MCKQLQRPIIEKKFAVKFGTLLKISRPGLWFPTLWIYILPLGGQLDLLNHIEFWLGLLFVLFPLNLFVYSLNDLGDVDADAFNIRKGNFLFGAKASKEKLVKACKIGSWVLGIFALLFYFISGWKMLVLFGAIVLINYIYNFPPWRIKSRPPFELFIQIGYILTAVFSSVLNEVALIPWQAFIYLVFFCFQAHLAGEIMDIDPDRLAKKTTTASVLGRQKAKWLMVILLCAEVYILSFWFQDYVLASVLALFVLWLLLDIFILFKSKSYTLNQMYLFGYGMNAIGIASMLWILYTGKLLLPLWP
ncbi:MAG: UbiA family prenyltransferase [Bacteroidia bacterium]